VLCIFPFEPEFLARHGVQGHFVGHPLADEIPLQVDAAAARQTLGLPAGAPCWPCCPAAAAANCVSWPTTSCAPPCCSTNSAPTSTAPCPW
jgi:hypothetical protein